ncbi:MAG: FtsW/RodA/SpoVE family cell cycle protein, partial [Emergencia timonensis]
KNSLIFMIFSGFCFCCLALMGDFGTALIFFVTFLVISFLRSGDFTKLILIVGVAFVGGLMVLKFKSYIAERFASWGHAWDYADVGSGFQQTRTMSAAASGGLVGVGAGKGWLSDPSIPASDTDLVFGMLTEEWGLIIAILAVLSIITLSIFAVRSIWAGRSTYYTIAACSAMSMLLFQTILNVFGSVDLLPLTGVTFPFVSNGGTSMMASWGLLAFLKSADTRQNASIAISLSEKGLAVEGDDDI